MNRYYKIFFVFVVTFFGLQSLFSQDRDSLGLILNFRGSGNLLEEFNDYTGVSFSESALVRLQQEVSALDSADHEGFLFSPYEIMGQQYGINQPFLDSALIALNGAKKILFSVNNLGGYPEETVFSVDIVNPDLLISEVDGIEDELKYLMNASSINNEIPEVFALAIERYLDVINPAGLYQSYFENNLQVLLDDDTYPSFELDSIANFIALSGVPIKLPAGSRVKFLRFDDDQKGMLYCFRLPGNSYYHTPKKWKAGTSNAGKFAGYGYWSPADWNSSSKVIFYSYEDYLVHNGGCGFPPYTLGEVTEVLLGYTKGCPGNEGELYIYPRLYKTYFEDITSPESPDEGYPAYRAANENVTFADIDQHIINSTQQVFDDSCSQEVITLHHNQLLKDIPFPCGISSDLVPLSALSSGEYYFIHFDNGVEAVMSIHQGRQFLAYLDNDAELVVLEYDKFYGWFYSDFQGPQFSKDAGIILNFAGELALQAGITSVFIAVNVYLGGAVAAMAAPYGVETGALLLLDLAVSAGEASSVYMITDDSNLAMQAFFAGAVGSVGGTLLTNSIKGFRLTSSDDLDVLFKTRTYSEIPQDASASYMTKRLREFKSEVRSSGMSDDLFRTLLIDMESSDDLARYILSDYKRVRAWWEALYDLPNLRPQANWLEFVEEAVSTHGLKYRQAGLSAKAVSSTSSNWVTQNISDFDQLYADATVAKTELDNIMNSITSQVGGTPSSRLKDPARAREKIDLDPDPDANYSWLTDLAGGRIVYDNLDDFYDALDNVVGNYQVARLNERVVMPLPTGFRDVLMNLRMSNGHVVELQISLKEMIEASDGPGHTWYEEWRTLNGIVQSQQGGVATAAQAAELENLMTQMQNLYNGAYQQILSRQ